MKKEFVIGVDGGGTRTRAVLADLNGKAIKEAEAGPSSPRNLGSREASRNIYEAVSKIMPEEKNVGKIIIGLAAVSEQPDLKKEVLHFLRENGLSEFLLNRTRVISDQLVAFRAGTNSKEGVVLIAGTGAVARGWRGEKEVKVNGWGYLADEGSAYWVGRLALEAIFKDIDGRGKDTKITEVAFDEIGVKSRKILLDEIYNSPPTLFVPRFSVFCDEAASRGDETAVFILQRAGEELALSALTVIRELNFEEEKFPLVLVGGMFKSRIVLQKTKEMIEKNVSRVEFLEPKEEVVKGALRIALESYEKN